MKVLLHSSLRYQEVLVKLSPDSAEGSIGKPGNGQLITWCCTNGTEFGNEGVTSFESGIPGSSGKLSPDSAEGSIGDLVTRAILQCLIHYLELSHWLGSSGNEGAVHSSLVPGSSQNGGVFHQGQTQYLAGSLTTGKTGEGEMSTEGKATGRDSLTLSCEDVFPTGSVSF